MLVVAVVMGGLITERDFAEAEAAFPGIAHFYAALNRKPRTFLDLVWLYFERGARSLPPCPGASSARSGGEADLPAVNGVADGD